LTFSHKRRSIALTFYITNGFSGCFMKRTIERALLAWKQDPERRVLLVRGARQVGKTYSIRVMGKTFQHFVEVNLEEHSNIHVFFRDSLNPFRLCEKLAAYFSTPIVAGETLLFFDEIQSCPEALSSLRFFHEKMPDLHVVGAGSLLEFAMSELPSLGVGRITSLFMYPLTFEEYLWAMGEIALNQLIEKADAQHPLDAPFHRRLVDHVRTYQLVGGMPAAVKCYSEKRDLSASLKILDDLITTLQDDFAKYKKRAPVVRLGEVFRGIVLQSGGKFKYTRVDSASSAQALKDTLLLLVKAGLAHRVVHTHARGIPLGAQVDEKKFKVILFDIGIHQRLLGLDVPSYLTATDLELVHKGSLAEVLTGLELTGNHPAHTRPALYYWHREARGSNAEIDYVIQQGATIMPVEVKAGTKGQMQSLYRFIDERGLKKGIRVSLENFGEYDRIQTVPLYAIRHLLRMV
jgi:predicted AAA+ superfamily ATPase